MKAALGVIALTAHAHAEPPRAPGHTSFAVAPRLEINGDVAAFGAGAHYLRGFPPTEPAWFGGGVDVRAMVADGSFAGMALTAVAKVTAGHAPPMTLQIEAGALIGEHSAAVIGAGAYLSLLYVELGYAYQRTLLVDSSAAMAGGHHLFSIRGIIPVVIR
jgi:hypothetical protein